MNIKYKKSLAITGIVIGFVPILYYILWIYISGNNSDHTESVVQFTKFLPQLFQDMRVATILFIVLCLMSISLTVSGLKLPNCIFRFSCLVMITACSALMVLLAFSLL